MLYHSASKTATEVLFSSVRQGPRPVYLAAALAIPTAWLTAALLGGRALPWQADRWWLLVFGLAFLPAGVWWWRFYSRAGCLASSRGKWLSATLLGTVPFLAVALPALALAYTSDPLNHLIVQPYWRLPFAVGVGLLLLASESFQLAATIWLQQGDAGLRATFGSMLARRANRIALGCVLLVALLQAAASVAPVGDDVWHYIKVADTLRDGLRYPEVEPSSSPQYPVDIMGHDYLRAGMGRLYPALPVVPSLMAIAFTVVGHNLFGVALVLALSTALFGLAMYSAFISLTGSRLASYMATMLLYLFPIYQIHILGAPEPDAMFVALLLLGIAVAAKANRSPRRRDWVALGVIMALAALTRHEGIIYSVALFGIFLLFHYSKMVYWLAGFVWLGFTVPFAVLHYSLYGTPWPTTFAGTLAFRNLEANLTLMSWTSMPWFASAVGVSQGALVGLLAAFAVAAMLGGVDMLRRSPALVFIPLAGLGDLGASMLVHPTVLQTASPIELLRHVSSGLAYTAVAAMYAVFVGYRLLAARLSPSYRGLLGALLVLLFCVGLYYEAERLARPEYYFEGPASLLWTGSAYLLTDVYQYPVALPDPGDPRDGEQLRNELGVPLDPVDLRGVNRSEPYHWATLMLALFGLFYVSLRSSLPPPSPASHGGVEPGTVEHHRKIVDAARQRPN